MELLPPLDIGIAVEEHVDVDLEIQTSQLIATLMLCSRLHLATNTMPSSTDLLLYLTPLEEETGLIKLVVNASSLLVTPTLVTILKKASSF
mgnify:CR=1 FL=1